MVNRILRLSLALLIAAMLACCSDGEQNRPPPAGDEATAWLELQLAELSSLPIPQGVEPAEWHGLKSELERSIRQRLTGEPGRQALAAPVTNSAMVRLFFDLDTSTFEWRYQNPGDYNQDGEVNISDLTPLAVHLGAAVSTAPGSENSIEAVVDGDGNGLITIADITPLGAALGRRVTEYRLYFATSLGAYPEDNFEAPEIPHFASVALSDFQGSRSAERIYFTFASVPLSTGLYWVRPTDSTVESVGTPSKPLQPGFLGDITAELKATPFIGTAPLTVTLDASDSIGTGVTFHWDPEGDGTYADTGFNDSIIHIYPAEAAYTAAVRVISPSGFFRTARVGINAGGAAAWHRYALPELRATETPLAIAIDDYAGQPLALVSYRTEDPSLYGMDYYLASAPNGSIWGARELIYNTATEPVNRLQTLNALGNQVYGAALPSRLTYGAAADLPGDWSQANLLSVGGIEWISMRFIAGALGMAYYDPVADGLRYGQLGSSLQSPVPGTGHGECASLASINGAPAIAYFDQNGAGPDVIRYVDSVPGAAPVTWNLPVTVVPDTPGSRFFDSLLELADGSPGLLYYAPAVGEVRFRRASDSSGDSWSAVPVAPVVPGPDIVPRAVMVGNIPHGFWYAPDTAALMHSFALDEAALDWTEPHVVATEVQGDILPAPAEINGMPAVAYALNDGTIGYAIYY